MLSGARTSLRISSLCVIAWLVIFCPVVFAQEGLSHGKVGLSASLQGGQFEILVPVWVSNQMVVSPFIRVLYAQDVATDLGIGLGQRFNLRSGSVIPYLGVRASALILLPKDGSSVTDWVFGMTVGNECFLNEHLSLSAEAQFNFSVSSDESMRFGNPGGTNLNSATAVMATAYF